MKRIGTSVLVTGVVWLFAGDCMAQTTVGIRGGFTSAVVSGDELLDVGRRSGLSVGAFAEVGLGERVGVQLGASYTQKGVGLFVNGTDVDLDIDYIEFPVLLALSLTDTGPVSPRLLAGPVIAFESRCRVHGTQVELTISLGCDDPSLDGDLDTALVDVGAAFGGGITIALGGRSLLTIEALYNLGLRSIDPNELQDVNRNRAFVVTGGFALQLGG